jgi:hypothetical protein
VTVHEGFDWWLGDVADHDQDMSEALEQANGAVAPTARLTSVEAAYWVDAGSKEHLRWVLPHDESAALDALARLHASGDDSIADGSKLVGMFRAHGLLTPVWDLPSGTGAQALEGPVAAFSERLEAALSDGAELSSQARAARSLLTNQQVTLR